MDTYANERQSHFPVDAEQAPGSGRRSAPREQRYPAGVEVCPSPEAYYHAMRRSGGELCVRLVGPGEQALVRYDDGVWRCILPRGPRESPVVRTLDRAAVLARLRRRRPVLVAAHEVGDLLAGGRGPAAPGDRRPAADPRRAGGRP